MKWSKWIGMGAFLTFCVVSVGFLCVLGVDLVKIESVSEKAVSTYQYHFVLVPEELDNEYWQLVQKGAADAAEVHRVYLEYLGPKQADVDDHLKTIDMAIAGHVDGIMTQGLDATKYKPLFQKAREKGIDVVTVDTDAEESKRQVYVGTDNYYSGFIAGQALIADTKGEQYVGIVTGRLDAIHQKLRVKGFRDAVSAEKRIHLVGIEESAITKSGASGAAYKLLNDHAELTAFYGTSALDGVGIIQATEQYRSSADFYVLAFDTLPDTIQALDEGEIDAVVVQHPYEMGYQAVESLVRLQKGEKEEPLQYTGTSVIRRKDLPLYQAEKLQGVQP
ncbi:sugar-binding protein [Bacillus xiamenensis]|uniref:sugar-binding protein n=1 Tax=Bacillus xiamenensis TaxID=1178537 RepID=UPI00028BECEB|nr:sugar-binding protein [Bacillus xiamenensis]EKF35916.1 sugar ABC transporter ATP-binding protein [Bacillus xiamenensis]